jgi:hypothetical protein
MAVTSRGVRPEGRGGDYTTYIMFGNDAEGDGWIFEKLL